MYQSKKLLDKYEKVSIIVTGLQKEDCYVDVQGVVGKS